MLGNSKAWRAAVMAAAAGALVVGPSAAAFAQSSSAATRAKTGPIMFFNIQSTAKISGTDKGAIKPAVVPPPVLACLPVTPPSPIPGCVPPAPPAGEPWPGNMAYFGGHIQQSPKLYLVYWGWDTPGAFKNSTQSSCGTGASDTQNWPGCDPDGAGQRIYNFVDQLGGTSWADTQTQYYENDANGNPVNITDPTNQLAGVWIDDSSHPTWNSSTAIGGVQTQLGTEAQSAVQHFGLSATDLLNANIIVVQPQNYSDPAAASAGYCAWHDYTEPTLEGGVYNGLEAGISFTNMPYILNQGTSCGQNVEGGNLDGESIVLGHEIEETVTDPGAEDVITNANGTTTNLGGWYDSEAYENGDKCAWVGTSPVWEATGAGSPTIQGFPGAVGTMTGNKGTLFPVQSLWSDNALGGVGYCAGAGTDLPAAPGGGTVPEAPLALLVPLLGLGTAGSIIVVRRRRRTRLASIS